jgi:hypothetical protein
VFVSLINSKVLIIIFFLHFRSPFEGFFDRLKEDNPRDYSEESFSTLNRRHTYFQQKENESSFRGGQQPLKKLGVRLRARQVLCNKCKNVCTENGETVQPKRNTNISSRTQQQQQQKEPTSSKQKAKCTKYAPSSSSTDQMKFSLVPKIRRLNPVEIEKFSPPRPAAPGIQVVNYLVLFKSIFSDKQVQIITLKFLNI